VPTPPSPARPRSYLLVGPPDLLHDLTLDFADVGWQVDVVRWHAVVTAPAEEADGPTPEWPTEVTLLGTSRDGHAEACRAFLVPHT
jgi:hypothetical protein